MKHIKILIKSILFILNCLCHNINIILQFKNFMHYISLQNEIKVIERYLIICKDFNTPIKFKKVKDPKISIISPTFNRERFVGRFLNSIQLQNFNNIEIILIDDCSTDNSVKIIEDYKKKDERIVLIKNNKNKGTFVSRNIGVLYGKGKYIILPDPDDILSSDIISFCYNYAQKYNYELIRFIIYNGNGKIDSQKFIPKLGNKPVYHPKVSTNIFYGYNELEMMDFCINNKFIKSEIYVKALNSLNNSYLNIYNIFMEDQIMNYLIHKFAKSFYFFTKIGYYYLPSEISITKNTNKIPSLLIKCLFLYLKIFFEYSKNTKYEKDMSNFLFSRLNRKFDIISGVSRLSSKDDLYFYYFVIKIYLNNKFITNENKNYFKYLKSII